MKKLIILSLIIVPFISGCKKEDEISKDDSIRKIAWNSLNENEKLTVIIDWKKAPVSETTYLGKDAYSVTFSTSEDALLGPIIVFIDVYSKAILGQGLRM